MGEDVKNVTRDDVRRLLNHLRDLHSLAGDPALAALCPDHVAAAPSVAGAAAARRLTEAIERLRPAEGADRHEQLPYLVLKLVFVDGVKMVQATDRLVLSRRQLTRECARAVDLLHGELSARPAGPVATGYAGEPVPTIADFLARPEVLRRLGTMLAPGRMLHVHGPKGVGKTSLVAEYAAAVAVGRPVVWQRFRPGTNNTWLSLAFELGEYLASCGHPELADYLHGGLTTVQPALVGRMLVRDLRNDSTLFIFDDFHHAESDQFVASLLDELAVRVPSVSIVTIGLSRPEDSRHAAFEMPPLSAAETHALLGHLGLRAKPEMAELIRDWTQGVTHLVRLAASWMRTVTVSEVSRGLEDFTQLDEVQSFLINSVTDLLDRRDVAVLQAASVFRDRFSDAAVAHVAERTIGEVRDTSRRLVRHHVATRGRGGDVAFFHASVREYFYHHLDGSTAMHMHARAAEWFAARGDVGEAAYHTERLLALQPAPTARRTAPPASRGARQRTHQGTT